MSWNNKTGWPAPTTAQARTHTHTDTIHSLCDTVGEAFRYAFSHHQWLLHATDSWYGWYVGGLCRSPVINHIWRSDLQTVAVIHKCDLDPAVRGMAAALLMFPSAISLTHIWSNQRYQYPRLYTESHKKHGSAFSDHNSRKSWSILITFTYLETGINALCKEAIYLFILHVT